MPSATRSRSRASSRLTAAPAPKQERSIDTRQRLLDAAVDELLDQGYARMTSTAAAHRAGVSRGAQQHHFPHKELLVVEAVRHLAARGAEQLESSLRAASEKRGREQAELVIDALQDAYSGLLFAAMVELSLAGRAEPSLKEAVSEAERDFSRRVEKMERLVFADGGAAEGFALRWALVLAALRGIAILALLGHPPRSVAKQFAEVRPELMRMLLEAETSA